MPLFQVEHSDSRSQGRKHIKQRGARRIQQQVIKYQVRPGKQRGRAHEECRGRNIPRNLRLQCMRFLLALSADPAPLTCKGGLPPLVAEILAPIYWSGSMMRAIGRRESDSSPFNAQLKSCPASIPASIRMVEPELPQSNARSGGLNLGPRPLISIEPSELLATWHPKARKQSSVLAQSAPCEKLLNSETP